MSTYKNSCRVCGQPAKPGDRLALGYHTIRHSGCGCAPFTTHMWTVAPDGVSLLWRGSDDGDDRLDAPALDVAACRARAAYTLAADEAAAAEAALNAAGEAVA